MLLAPLTLDQANAEMSRGRRVHEIVGRNTEARLSTFSKQVARIAPWAIMVRRKSFILNDSGISQFSYPVVTSLSKSFWSLKLSTS